MKLRNAVVRVRRRGSAPWIDAVADAVRETGDDYPLRVALVHVDDRFATLDATLVSVDPGDRHGRPFETVELFAPRTRRATTSTFAVVQIVPTGVRCELGGYAGDACPVTNLLAAAADVVITHPNAVNASDINELASNVLYVEGKNLDDLLLGYIGLAPVRANRVGTFVDPTGLAYLDDVVHALNAGRAAAGIDCGRYTIAPEELDVAIEWTRSGCAVGTVGRPEAILAAAEQLIAAGAQAVGGVSVIHGVSADAFREHLGGRIPNPSGGVEAIITHLLSKVLRVPAAHAPLPYYAHVKTRDTANPRASAEFISTPHYFSVLKGLARAPRPIELDDLAHVPNGVVSLADVGAIVMPATCLGGLPALCAELNDIPLVAVADNETVLDVTNERMRFGNVIPVRSYAEAAGIVLALRAGIAPESLRRPLTTTRPLAVPAAVSARA